MQIDLDYMKSIEERGKTLEWQVYLAAQYYVNQGFYVIPLRKNSKWLLEKSHNIAYAQATRNEGTIHRWFHPEEGRFAGHNIALATGRQDGIFAVDVDRHGDIDGFENFNKILEEYDDKMKGPSQTTPGKGKHYIFEWQENAVSSSGKIAPGIDTRGGRRNICSAHIVVFPSEIDGIKYRWDTGGKVPRVPKWALDKMGIVWTPKKYTNRGNENVYADDIETKVPQEQLERMLDAIDPDALEYDEWLRIGQAINTQFATDVGLQIWDNWSQRGQRYNPKECVSRWSGFDPTGPVRVASLFYYAKSIGDWEPEENDVNISKHLSVIEKLNNDFAVVVVGGKIRILRERKTKSDPSEPHYDLMDKESFRTLFQNETIEYINNQGRTVKVSIADVWLASDVRRTYPNGLKMMPDVDGHSMGYFNTWDGFAVDPLPGDCSLLLNHIKEVICDGDEDIYNWVLDWCADSVQDPANPKGACVVMRGKEGVGKGTLANTMGELFGSHYRHLIDDSHLLSNFNAHMIDAIFVFADEITWGGNNKTSGKLKGMVTEEWLVGERKGIDAVGYRNMIHMMIASNNDWVIPAGMNSRRWLVLDVNDSKVKDRQYWNDIRYFIENRGREYFLHYLLNRKIESDLRKAPDTTALRSQQVRSMRFNSITSWWVSSIVQGSLDVVDVEDQNRAWPELVIKSELYDNYFEWCNARREYVEHVVNFGKEIKKFGLMDGRKKIGESNIRVCKIGTLERCTEKLTETLGFSVEDYIGE